MQVAGEVFLEAVTDVCLLTVVKINRQKARETPRCSNDNYKNDNSRFTKILISTSLGGSNAKYILESTNQHTETTA